MLGIKVKDFGYVAITVLIVISIFSCQSFWIIPNLYPYSSTILWIVLATFLFFEAVMCFWLAMRTNTSIRGKIMPGTLLPNWQYCFSCQANRPPRAYHCESCNVCILKRDHHCIYTGCCIGYFNQRFFVLLLLWGVVGCTLATYNNLSYFVKTTRLSFLGNLFFFFLPLLSYATGSSGIDAVFALHYTSTFYTFGTCVALLIYQLILIYRNQTVHEWKKSDMSYANISYGKFFRNFRSVFGSSDLFVTFLLPFKASSLESDGLFTAENVIGEHGKFS